MRRDNRGASGIEVLPQERRQERDAVGVERGRRLVEYPQRLVHEREAREPNAPRPFKAWGHPITTAIAIVASIAFLVGAVIGDPRNSIWAVALLAVSFPIYRLIRREQT